MTSTYRGCSPANKIKRAGPWFPRRDSELLLVKFCSAQGVGFVGLLNFTENSKKKKNFTAGLGLFWERFNILYIKINIDGAARPSFPQCLVYDMPVYWVLTQHIRLQSWYLCMALAMNPSLLFQLPTVVSISAILHRLAVRVLAVLHWNAVTRCSALWHPPCWTVGSWTERNVQIKGARVTVWTVGPDELAASAADVRTALPICMSPPAGCSCVPILNLMNHRNGGQHYWNGVTDVTQEPAEDSTQASCPLHAWWVITRDSLSESLRSTDR